MSRLNGEGDWSINQPPGGAAPRSKRRFRFGRFELDVHARELRKDGVRFRLQDQPFVVLTSLLQHPGEVFTREELCRELWPDGTFVDFEHGLNAAVKRLRTALGDTADAPRFVETLHRRGYRFIAPVDEGDARPAAGLDAISLAPTRLATTDEPMHDSPDRKPRLAVLPFVDLGGHDSQAYFTEGLTEETITQFGRVCAGRLGVVARASSMLVQRAGASARQIGEALRADYLVEGGVRRDGHRVRITVRLVETRSETQLWANSYDRDLSDCFAVQSEVAAEAVRSLAMELLPDTRPPRSGTHHAQAYQAYMIGLYHWNKAGTSGLDEAAAHFQRALRLDPSFAAAYAVLGRTAVAAATYHQRDPRGALEEARKVATRALALDPTESEAHVTMAEVRKCIDWDWNGAEDAYRTALSFNPSNAAVLRLYGLFLAARGRSGEAVVTARRACDLDPLCLVVNTSAAWVEYLAGDHTEAIERCQHTLDMDQRFVTARRQLAAALLARGNGDEAIAEIENDPESRADPTSVAWLAHAAGVSGQKERAMDLLRQLAEMAEARYVSAYHLALAYTGIGDADRAFTALDEACDARDPAIIDVGVEPRFAPLRSDSRYRDLMERLGVDACRAQR